jgi:aldose 1-epimerase
LAVSTTLLTFWVYNFLEEPQDVIKKISKIADKMAEVHPQITLGKGFDHHFIVDGHGLRNMAKVFEPISGRTLEVMSDAPGVQFYTGNFLDGRVTGKQGVQYGFRSGFCLETQHYPNSLNTPDFPSILLKAGEVYSSTCIYKFGVLELE